jgi:hypothetical protein
MRGRLLLLGMLVIPALFCGSESPSETGEQRADVRLLEVRLVSRVGSQEDALADDARKEVATSDTVWFYPVVKVAVGEKQQDTVYLSNTSRVRSVARASPPASKSSPGRERPNIWSQLKNDIRIEWCEVVPVRSEFGVHEATRYDLKLLSWTGWGHELTGQPGTWRLAVRARQGDQVVTSSYPISEADLAGSSWVACRADTTALGWAASLLGPLPYRAGSTPEQTANRVSCSGQSVVAYALQHIGYHFDAYNSETMDSLGQPVFSGYVKLGRLYDRDGRLTWLRLGQDVRKGDVIHWTTNDRRRRRDDGGYGFVAGDAPVRGLSFGGLPLMLPILGAGAGYPGLRPLYQVLLSLRTLFGKSKIIIRRYPSIPAPPSPARVRRIAPATTRLPPNTRSRLTKPAGPKTVKAGQPDLKRK